MLRKEHIIVIDQKDIFHYILGSTPGCKDLHAFIDNYQRAIVFLRSDYCFVDLILHQNRVNILFSEKKVFDSPKGVFLFKKKQCIKTMLIESETMRPRP